MAQPRLGLSLHHPAVLIATWFGAGLLPWAPGTWGSFAALPCAWVIVHFAGPASLALSAMLVFALGCWAAGTLAAASGHEDPGFIVVDEVAAQWLVLALAPLALTPLALTPLDWRAYAAAFVLFRVFDITKPWPARAIERRVKGGLGIMLDDTVAALYAAVLLLTGEGVFGVQP